jgi:hypothetical protein
MFLRETPPPHHRSRSIPALSGKQVPAMPENIPHPRGMEENLRECRVCNVPRTPSGFQYTTGETASFCRLLIGKDSCGMGFAALPSCAGSGRRSCAPQMHPDALAYCFAIRDRRGIVCTIFAVLIEKRIRKESLHENNRSCSNQEWRKRTD